MDCRACEQLISKFLDRTLEGDELRNFIMHVSGCAKCEEELGKAYLLEVALPRIENGETVNLKNELMLRLEAAKKVNSLHWVCSNIFRSLEVAAGITLALSAVRVFVIFVIPRLPF